MSVMPLVLIGYTDDKKEIILWKNPTPSSCRWSRPFRLLYQKETTEFAKSVMGNVQQEIDSLQPGNCNGLPSQYTRNFLVLQNIILCAYEKEKILWSLFNSSLSRHYQKS